MRFALFLCGLTLAAPALADTRGFSVTSFSRVRVEGPVTVEIVTGGAPKARAEGDRVAIDRLRIETSGEQLLIGMDRTNWTGGEGRAGGGRAVIYVSAPRLDRISVIGPGTVRVDRASGAGLGLIMTGAGRISVDRIAVDQLTTGINGAGSATLAGTARQVRIRSQGEGEIDAAGLTADDADVSLIGAGEVKLAVRRAARTTLKGSGRIVIDGAPACTGTSEGSGEVICGSAAP